jgi:hypothetical protein
MACVTAGGNLVQINDAAEQQHILDRIPLFDTWIGAQRTSGVWNWRGAVQIQTGNTHSTTVYTRWDRGEPNGGDNSCAYLRASGGHLGWWDDTGCTSTGPRYYLCERTDPAMGSWTCGDGKVTGTETCDPPGAGCIGCQRQPGYFCSLSGGACTLACNPLGTGAVGANPTEVNSFSRFPQNRNNTDTETGWQTHEYTRCPTPLNAFHAELTCESFGAGWQLADINSVTPDLTVISENNVVANRLPTGRWWIGATDENAATGNRENTFRWRDGINVGATTAWEVAGSQPDNGSGASHAGATPPAASHGQDCVSVTYSAVTNALVRNWDDEECAATRGFVCEGPAICGNAAVADNEACDKGAGNGQGLGCTATCTITPGYGCLLPGGNSAPDDAPSFVETCSRGPGGSCCFQRAQAVIGDVSIVGGELAWTTVSEAGTTGFAVEAQVRGQWRALHEGVLPALPDAAQGASYRLRAGSLRGRAVRITEHELGGAGLVVYEGVPAVGPGAATLTTSEYSVVANALTGAPDMAADAAPSPAAIQKAAGDTPVGVFVQAANEGLVRVTFSDLAAELRVPVATVTASVTAGELSVTTYGTPVAWTQAGDAVVFNARRRTSVYSATRSFEVRLSAGVELGAVDRSLADVAAGSGSQRFFHEVDRTAAIAVGANPSEEFWFEASLGNHSAFQDYDATFTLSDVDSDAGTLDLRVYGWPGLTEDLPLTLALTFNGQVLDSQLVTTEGLQVLSFVLPSGALLAGPNTVHVRATSSAPAGTAGVYVDSYTVNYTGPLEFGTAGRFVATASGALAFELDAATGTPAYLLDATLDRVVAATRTAVDATHARFTFDAQAGHEYFVASESGLQAPSALRARSEQHFADGSRAGEYVVIAPAALYDAATALATRRQTQGLTTAVVDVQDIYDAFGHGEHDPNAIREFLRVASGSWSSAPRYVLLLGDGNYDYRGVRATGSGAIPPLMLQTAHGIYASDMMLGDTDGNGRADIAIGRVPAHTAQEADAFVQRVVTYESGNLDAFTRDALLVSGINRGEDYTGYVNRLASQLDERVNAERINRGALTLDEARTQLLAGVNEGSFWFHYQGHGASTQLDDDGLLTMADVAGLSNSNALTIFTGMSCSTSRFEVPGMDSISELMLNGSPGGAIALYGPSGPGYSYHSGNMAEAFQRHLLTGDHLVDARMGDVVMGLWLHQSQGGANTSSEQLAIYLLLGDPATKLPDRSRLAPPPVVVVDPPVDGGTSEPEVDAGGMVRVDLGTEPPVVTPPGGGIGGGACAVSVGNGNSATGGLVLLLGLTAWVGRRARRRSR